MSAVAAVEPKPVKAPISSQKWCHPAAASSPPKRLTARPCSSPGTGQRMKSRHPKVLHRLAGRSLLAHVLHATAALDDHHTMSTGWLLPRPPCFPPMIEA